MRLADRTIIVTGAGSGIGKETAVLAAREGARVVASDMAADVHSTVSVIANDGGVAEGVLANVCKSDDCELLSATALERFGRIDGLVHAAGVSSSGTATTESLEAWNRVIETDLTSGLLLARAIVPHLGSPNGSVVFVSSTFGLVGGRGAVAYAAAKAGLINLARSMALDHASAGIRVNCVCPGPIATGFLDRYLERQDDAELAKARLLAGIPMGRFGTSAEIAAGILFLLSSESSFMTGTTLVIDGGVLAQ